VPLVPLGMRREDQTSCAPQSGVRGGQLMTGYAVFPDITGPRPLLLPATATNTVGTPSPEDGEKHADVLRRDRTVTFFFYRNAAHLRIGL